MSSEDINHFISSAFANRHRQLEFVFRYLFLIQGRLRREHVIKRRETVSSFGSKRDAEILPVSVRGANQPIDDLRLEKGSLILDRLVGALQEFETINDAWSALVLVFFDRRYAHGLTKILLRTP